MTTGHAYLPPSGAGAWGYCALWPLMNHLYPKPDTEDSINGTAAHDGFYEILYGRIPHVGQVAKNGVPLTEEMLEASQLYVDVIDRDLAACGIDRRWLRVEQRVYMPRIHPLNDGTPDTWFYAEHLRTIYLYDFKFGHDFVDAFENLQCVDYVEGVAELLGIDGMTDQATKVVIRVIQPRNFDRDGPVRTWEVTLSDLRPYFNRLRNQAEKAMKEKPEAVVGDYCRHCPGRAKCNTLQREGYKAAALGQEQTPLTMPPEALVLELRMLKKAEGALKARISGLEAEAESRGRFNGERMPGCRWEDTYGRERWKVPPEQVIAMGAAMSVNLAKPGTLTPIQAVKAGMPASIVDAFREKPHMGVKLVLDDGRHARKVFGSTS